MSTDPMQWTTPLLRLSGYPGCAYHQSSQRRPEHPTNTSIKTAAAGEIRSHANNNGIAVSSYVCEHTAWEKQVLVFLNHSLVAYSGTRAFLRHRYIYACVRLCVSACMCVCPCACVRVFVCVCQMLLSFLANNNKVCGFVSLVASMLLVCLA